LSGGHQEGNAAYVSSDQGANVILHEALSSLGVYSSGEKGKYTDDLHSHN
jgi:hypothetical protein